MLPAFAEADNLHVLFPRLLAQAHLADELEIVVVDDHSPDETFSVVRDWAARDPRIRGLRLARNGGSHMAILCGLRAASGDALIVLAADGQDPPEAAGQLLEAWSSGAQVVWAVRESRENESLATRLSSRLYYALMNRLTTVRLPPTGADFFLLDRRVLGGLLAIPEHNVSIFALVVSLGFRQTSIGYTKQSRLSGRSKWTLRRKVRLFLDSLVGFSTLPLRLATGLGFAARPRRLPVRAAARGQPALRRDPVRGRDADGLVGAHGRAPGLVRVDHDRARHLRRVPVAGPRGGAGPAALPGRGRGQPRGAMSIPFLTLARQVAGLRAELVGALEGVVDSQGFANGPAVAAFEQELARYLGVREVVALNSGTSALHAALVCAGVGPGDEVVTVAHTWISTAWAVSYVGARPVFVDVDRATCGLDPSLLEKSLSPRTRAILPVHLYGHPVDLDPVLEVAGRHGIPVIEDCAQSIGARYKGRMTGGFGLVNATSFYPGKNLGALGEGGAVLTDDAGVAARVRRLRDHAQDGRHHHVEIGFNWRMDGFQGAVLSVKLRHLERWNARRGEIARLYLEGLAGVVGLTLPRPQPWADPIWHIFPVYHERRDALRSALEERGVQTGVHYPRPVHLQPAYAHLGLGPGSLPVSELLARTEVSLPMFPELTDAEVERVVQAVRDACRSTGA